MQLSAGYDLNVMNNLQVARTVPAAASIMKVDSALSELAFGNPRKENETKVWSKPTSESKNQYDTMKR